MTINMILTMGTMNISFVVNITMTAAAVPNIVSVLIIIHASSTRDCHYFCQCYDCSTMLWLLFLFCEYSEYCATATPHLS